MLFILLIIVGSMSHYLLSWWAFPVASFIVALFLGKGWIDSTLHSFAAGVLVWGGFTYWAYSSYDPSFFDKFSNLLTLPSGLVLVIVTALLGGFLTGLAGAAGFSVRSLQKK